VQAKSLVRSIRYRTSGIPTAVATDFDQASSERPVRSRDPWSFARSPGVVSKLELFNLTTFDTTLFSDADCR
jgi:hypothetical protein